MAADDNVLNVDELKGPAQDKTQPKVVWDETDAQQVYANAIDVEGGRDEIALLFGNVHPSETTEKEIKVQLSDRIVLSPLAAKRLLRALETANTTEVDGHRPTAVWDNGGMTSTYANRVEVTASRDAIDILFGVEQARQSGQNEIRIKLSKHVILSPLVAQRLVSTLANVIGDHQAQWGVQAPMPAVSGKELTGTQHKDRDDSGREERLEKVVTLFRQLGSLETKIDLEHSFKAIHGGLFENRFLLGVNRREAGYGADKKIALICGDIGMPSDLLASFTQTLPHANHVYFGVEKDAQSLIFKAYLEYRDKIEKEIRGVNVSGRSYPLFTGWKWDTSDPSRKSVTEYVWYPSLPVTEILERLQLTFASGEHQELLEIVRGITGRTSKTISHEEIQYLEVTEEGNPRRSFDINIYKAGLRLLDIQPYLLKAVRHYAIPSGRFLPLYERIKTERLGHLAGGLDRENRDFMTLYYGVKHMESGQLRSARIGSGGRR